MGRLGREGVPVRRHLVRRRLRRRLARHSARPARRDRRRLGHRGRDGVRGRAACGGLGPERARVLLDVGPRVAQRRVRHRLVHRRHDPLPARKDGGHGGAPRRHRKGAAHPLLRAGHVVLPRPQALRRALPGPVQDDARLLAHRGGRPQGAFRSRLRPVAHRDDGHELLLFAPHRGGAPVRSKGESATPRPPRHGAGRRV
mmetsp:Transcript_15389/g.45812  ORF Transcript_15389/g.45812 Transcript_15389/m.45812 type:complete len:200 (+) Transcript_15389:264-863(+)